MSDQAREDLTEAYKYTFEFISDIVHQSTTKIEELYIPSCNLIVNIDPSSKKLNVFKSDKPRNYIQKSTESTWSDDFLEEMKTNEKYRKMYEKDQASYIPPQPTELFTKMLPNDIVKNLVNIVEIESQKSILSEPIKQYLK